MGVGPLTPKTSLDTSQTRNDKEMNFIVLGIVADCEVHAGSQKKKRHLMR